VSVTTRYDISATERWRTSSSSTSTEETDDVLARTTATDEQRSALCRARKTSVRRLPSRTNSPSSQYRNNTRRPLHFRRRRRPRCDVQRPNTGKPRTIDGCLLGSHSPSSNTCRVDQTPTLTNSYKTKGIKPLHL